MVVYWQYANQTRWACIWMSFLPLPLITRRPVITKSNTTPLNILHERKNLFHSKSCKEAELSSIYWLFPGKSPSPQEICCFLLMYFINSVHADFPMMTLYGGINFWLGKLILKCISSTGVNDRKGRCHRAHLKAMAATLVARRFGLKLHQGVEY